MGFDRQAKLLDLLDPVVRKIPWERLGPRYDLYRAEAAKLAAQEVHDSAFVATRTTLIADLPAYVKGVAAIGPAYRTVEEIEHGLGIRNSAAAPLLPGKTLSSILAWEFFVPKTDERLSSEELLKETVDFVSGNDEFRKHRTAFIKWQEKFLRGRPNRRGIDQACSQGYARTVGRDEDSHEEIDDQDDRSICLRVRARRRWPGGRACR